MNAPAQPLVSVIMIFYNSESFIQEAIDSVFEQTYLNWELILVDDGSEDGSSAIAQQAADMRPGQVCRVEHAGHINQGMSASRNLGLSVARGKYVAFLDADDIYLPQKLEKQVAILEAHPQAGMVFGPSLHWYSWTGRREHTRLDFLRKMNIQPDSLLQPPRLVRAFLFNRVWTPGTCSVLVRRDVIDQVGGFEDSFKGMMEDQIFFYKVGMHATTFAESGTWDRYRQHSGSTSVSAMIEGEYDIFRPNPSYEAFYRWLYTYFKAKHIHSPLLWLGLYRKFWKYRFPWLYRIARPIIRRRHARTTQVPYPPGSGPSENTPV